MFAGYGPQVKAEHRLARSDIRGGIVNILYLHQVFYECVEQLFCNLRLKS